MGDLKGEFGVDNKVISDIHLSANQFRDNTSFKKDKESDPNFTTIVLRDMHFNEEKETNDLRNLNFSLEKGIEEEEEFNEEEAVNEFRNLDVKEKTREIGSMRINTELVTGDLIDLNFDDEQPMEKKAETKDPKQEENNLNKQSSKDAEETIKLCTSDLETTEDELTDLSFSPPPMKHSDTRDSISSIDSDISLPFDPTRRPSDEGANLADMSDSASEAGSTKDSGCEIVEPEFIPPSDEMADRIVAQVEFYFSDVNITKDAFLLKHVKRNKEGYVSLKLISSFKRVKHLVKDWRAVAYSLTRSTKLKVNEAGTKLCRTDPLPEYDETTPSRTVIAVNLPSDKPTIESVAELFSTYGEIALVRILRPGNPIPADVRSFVAKRPELEGAVCALVEYVKTEGARKALQLQGRDWRGFSQGIRVVELRKPVKKSSVARLVDSEYSSSCSDAEHDPRHNFRRGSSSSSISSYSSRHGDSMPWSPRYHDSGSESDRRPSYERRFSNLSNASDNSFGDRRMSNTSSCCDRRLSNASSPCDRRISNVSNSCACERRLSNASTSSCCDRRISNSSPFDRRLSNNTSPFDRRLSNSSMSSSGDRRMSNSSVSSSGDRRMSNSSNCGDRWNSGTFPTDRRTSTGSHLPDNVVRLPLGPDGSPGFRQRPNLS